MYIHLKSLSPNHFVKTLITWFCRQRISRKNVYTFTKLRLKNLYPFKDNVYLKTKKAVSSQVSQYLQKKSLNSFKHKQVILIPYTLIWYFRFYTDIITNLYSIFLKCIPSNIECWL